MGRSRRRMWQTRDRKGKMKKVTNKQRGNEMKKR